MTNINKTYFEANSSENIQPSSKEIVFLNEKDLNFLYKETLKDNDYPPKASPFTEKSITVINSPENPKKRDHNYISEPNPATEKYPKLTLNIPQSKVDPYPIFLPPPPRTMQNSNYQQQVYKQVEQQPVSTGSLPFELQYDTPSFDDNAWSRTYEHFFSQASPEQPVLKSPYENSLWNQTPENTSWSQTYYSSQPLPSPVLKSPHEKNLNAATVFPNKTDTTSLLYQETIKDLYGAISLPSSLTEKQVTTTQTIMPTAGSNILLKRPHEVSVMVEQPATKKRPKLLAPPQEQLIALRNELETGIRQFEANHKEFISPLNNETFYSAPETPKQKQSLTIRFDFFNISQFLRNNPHATLHELVIQINKLEKLDRQICKFNKYGTFKTR